MAHPNCRRTSKKRWNVEFQKRLVTRQSGCKGMDRMGNYSSRNKKLLSDKALFSCEIERLSAQQINFWLCKFVLEIHRHDGEWYPSASLYQFCWGLMAELKSISLSKLSFIFRTTVDSEMKWFNSTGQYTHKWLAEPITVEDESILWGEHHFYNTIAWDC